MLKFNKFKWRRISKINMFSLHTYNMLDVFITNKNIMTKNEIKFSKSILDTLLIFRKGMNEVISYKLGARSLEIIHKHSNKVDKIELDGLKNSFKIIDITCLEMDFILECYKQIKNRKFESISILDLKRLTLKFETSKENVYIFLKNQK